MGRKCKKKDCPLSDPTANHRSRARWRLRIHEILEPARPNDRISKLVDMGLIALIVLSVTAIILESVENLATSYAPIFDRLQLFTVSIFTIEYLLRLWSCPESQDKRYHHPVKGRLNYMLSPMAVIDLIAILPFYLSMFLNLDLRILWLFRLLRLFKLARYSPAISILVAVISTERIAITAAVFFLGLVLVFAATGIYYFEHKAQPEQFTNIPAALWWAVVTVTTVGYGDMTPITPMGKIFAAMVSMAGVSMIAVPAGLLASRLTDELRLRRESYEDLLDEALDDGIISESEQQTIERHRQQLELSEEEAELLLRQAKRQSQKLEYCPHCGEKLADRKQP